MQFSTYSGVEVAAEPRAKTPTAVSSLAMAVPAQAQLPTIESPADSAEEDLFMTFQVALIGSDGLILGSDRKMFTKPPSFADNPSFAQFEAQSKFVCSENEEIICMCSGSQEAQRIAREIVQNLNPDVSDLEWRTSLDSLVNKNLIGYAQLVVVRKNYVDYAVWMVIGPQGYTSRIEEKQCVGAKLYACFLPGNFSRSYPVERLKRLALLTLDYAATESPTTVGNGYDLLTLRKGKAEWERYSADDERVTVLRKEFEHATESVIYPK